jgi:hypothetical protein
MNKKIISTLSIFLAGLVVLSLGLAAGVQPIRAHAAESPVIKIGTYGPLAPSGASSQQSTANLFNTLGLDWLWVQYDSGVPTPSTAVRNTLVNAGKRIILRTYFRNMVSSHNWTSMRAHPADYDAAETEILSEIADWGGASNLYGITFNEEEPSLSDAYFNGNPFSDTQVADYIYGVNLLYDRVKAHYPSLRIFQTVHLLSKFTDAQLNTLKNGQANDLKLDGLICYNYIGVASLQTYLQRGMAFASAKGIAPDMIFTLIYAGMDWAGNGAYTPQTVKDAFRMAVNIGLTNIGFFSDNARFSGASNLENLLFNNYAAGTDQQEAKQAMLDLINQYGGVPTPPPSSQAWDLNNDGLTNVLDLLLVSQHWNESGTAGWIPQDVNKDGIINALDSILIGQHWTG